ncbi:hypothetical protein [Tunicatimonas pelagia]|uniref:hypothetical protein n=1 Tax=Tunicatimonas pelagia TaxID=931531 RepID=UPI002665DD99|nr:hypothetical protein [Tunicatimonas pelagia]WKN40448.1 hypothetical protein P0M28_15495 [Tunicatimonas pelagia]
MNALRQRTQSLYSRTLLYLLAGSDVALWLLCYAVVTIFHLVELPNVLWIVSILLWIGVNQLTQSYRPVSVKGAQQVHQTALVALLHSVGIVVLCLLVNWQIHVHLVLYVSLGFYILRTITLGLLYRAYCHWKAQDNHAIRFITIGQSYTCRRIADYLSFNNARYLGHIPSEEIDDSFERINQLCVDHHVNHIYCTTPLPNLKELKQLADQHFVYLHWTPIQTFEGGEYELRDSHLVYTQRRSSTIQLT